MLEAGEGTAFRRGPRSVGHLPRARGSPGVHGGTWTLERGARWPRPRRLSIPREAARSGQGAQRRRASRGVRARRRGSRSLPFRLARLLLLLLDLHLSWPLSPPDALLVPRTDAMAAAGEWTQAGVLSPTLSAFRLRPRPPGTLLRIRSRLTFRGCALALLESPLAALCHLRPAGQSRLSEPAPSAQAGTAERPPPQPPRIWAPRAGSTLAPLLVVGHQPLWSRSRREPVYLLLRSLIRSNHGRQPALTSAPPARAPLSANSAPVWTAELPGALEREGASPGGRGRGPSRPPCEKPEGQRTEESAQPGSRPAARTGHRAPALSGAGTPPLTSF